MDWKPFVSSLLGILTVVALHTNQAAGLTKNGDNMLRVLFVAILVVQVLFEILSKYYGKTCELIDGTVTAAIVVGVFYLVKTILEKNPSLGGGKENGQSIGYILVIAVAVGVALYVWKTWLKPRIIPFECVACGPSVGLTDILSSYQVQSPIVYQGPQVQQQYPTQTQQYPTNQPTYQQPQVYQQATPSPSLSMPQAPAATMQPMPVMPQAPAPQAR